jgi:hypothetical protein
MHQSSASRGLMIFQIRNPCLVLKKENKVESRTVIFKPLFFECFRFASRNNNSDCLSLKYE